MDEDNVIVEEDVLGFEPDAVEDGAVEDVEEEVVINMVQSRRFIFIVGNYVYFHCWKLGNIIMIHELHHDFLIGRTYNLYQLIVIALLVIPKPVPI
ncbi:hypothetical protein C5167_009917 [Papaver somniferum]|uniref:Uncharacterized protein n=1 Tax=Papaver somniferum TaxID=3469 RepID=A0A4Y7K1L8_PAPSO|nr:hypothetical protein C5167_009917 [Papaver somniferum]